MKLNAIVLTTFLLIVNLYAVENPEDEKFTIQNGKGLFVLLDDTSWISQIVAEAYILGTIDGIITRKRPLRALCGNTVDKALLKLPMNAKIEEIYSSIDLALLWLDYYLALFTIASIKPLYSELYDFNNKDNNK